LGASTAADGLAHSDEGIEAMIGLAAASVTIIAAIRLVPAHQAIQLSTQGVK